MILAGQIVDRETKRKGLAVFWLRRCGRVHLTGFRLRFRSSHKLRLGEREQISQFCRIDEIPGGNRSLAIEFCIEHRHAADPVVIGLGRNRNVFEQNRELSVAEIGHEHGLQNRNRDAKLMREPRHGPVAGI
jgi:hypothetical protein